MTITFIGAGYVGLPSAALFADFGNKVWIVRRDREKTERLKRGEISIFEPGLEDLVKKNIAAGRLIPTTSYQESVPNSDIVFICVGTPSGQNGEADLSQVFEAAHEIGKNLKDYTVIVNKSTVPIGTAEKVREIISEELSKRETISHLPHAISQFNVASCPEFLREGQAVYDAQNPDRIVIGADSQKAQELLVKLHEPLPGGRVLTDIKTAEMIKYASNAFLATKISFINEIANLCDEVGANVEDVAKGIGLDKRIGPAFLKAGLGFGGSCFPKDTRALHSIAFSHDYNFQLLKAVIEVNQQQRRRFFQKVRRVLGELKDKKIGVLGLAFKNDTDDVRESAALDIVSWLIKEGAQIKAYDPQAETNAKIALPELTTCPIPEETAQEADAILIVTEWPQFKNLDWVNMKNKMNQPIVLDGRNLLDPKKMRGLGFIYISVGRP